MKYKYQGSNSSMRINGILFAKDIETELTDEQAKTLKSDRFGKAMIADGRLVEIKEAEDQDAKPISKMKVEELEKYIIENGGEFAESDNKPELLIIAQAIEDAQNDES